MTRCKEKRNQCSLAWDELPLHCDPQFPIIYAQSEQIFIQTNQNNIVIQLRINSLRLVDCYMPKAPLANEVLNPQ